MPFVHEEYSFPRVSKGGFCVFFVEKTGKCLIHEVKPETCVAGPVTFDINLKTGKIEWFLKNDDICFLARELRLDNQSFSAHVDIAKKQILQLIAKLEPHSLQVILKREEPETFKIGEEDAPRRILEKLNA